MIVLDSSFLCAWYNDRDLHHAAARGVMGRFLAGDWGRGLLVEYVFAEVVTVLLARRGRESALDSAHHLLAARELELVTCSDLFVDILETFRNQPGRSLSFADAAILTVARSRQATIATFDRGFHALEGLSVVPAASDVHESPAPP